VFLCEKVQRLVRRKCQLLTVHSDSSSYSVTRKPGSFINNLLLK
jgi:hypothetical protein